MKPIVILESPFASKFPENARRNVRYAQMALLDSLIRGESPYASHLLYTQVLADADPVERELGLDAAKGFYPMASLCAVYSDLGITEGMRVGINLAKKHGVPVELRKLTGWGVRDGRDG